MNLIVIELVSAYLLLMETQNKLVTAEKNFRVWRQNDTS